MRVPVLWAESPRGCAGEPGRHPRDGGAPQGRGAAAGAKALGGPGAAVGAGSEAGALRAGVGSPWRPRALSSPSEQREAPRGLQPWGGGANRMWASASAWSVDQTR